MGIQKTWHEKHQSTLSFGGLVADTVAIGMGSWTFILVQIALVIIWIEIYLI